ncbi:hypothetical protein M514_17067 [Trichuris suis]|uniref:Uncharacterized protein n=1 Tax=Trichuris suis TaxID=68888 RepID=A0A085NM99_9BILA|nr:hypothetical protein M514_17067 [Trichuris suis]
MHARQQLVSSRSKQEGKQYQQPIARARRVKIGIEGALLLTRIVVECGGHIFLRIAVGLPPPPSSELSVGEAQYEPNFSTIRPRQWNGRLS